MEKVTYILGAGFSAPLGLPVMRNFLIRSKDMYFSAPDRYAHFSDVFKTIEKMSFSKNYYDGDLFNVEEILSIIEMGDFVRGRRLRNLFARYICDVISYYTPPMQPYGDQLPGNWYNSIFGNNSIQEFFGWFVGNIFALEFLLEERQNYGRRSRRLYTRQLPEQETRYAIITLNYDLVLEHICDFIRKNYIADGDISFNKENVPGEWKQPPLAKLHGSADKGYVVPPTWAKGTHKKIAPTWGNAYQVLVESNHIRFIGYSLPVADSYIKYLLKAAVTRSPHLKTIDVICLDYDGSTRQRYDEFIKFGYYRFANADTYAYVHDIYTSASRSDRSRVVLNNLENVHHRFMEQYTARR